MTLTQVQCQLTNIRTKHYTCFKNAAIDGKANRRRLERKFAASKHPNVQIFKCLNGFIGAELLEVLSNGLFNKLADFFA